MNVCSVLPDYTAEAVIYTVGLTLHLRYFKCNYSKNIMSYCDKKTHCLDRKCCLFTQLLVM
jgi:hypothetical protein